jgi:hypothetical protein
LLRRSEPRGYDAAITPADADMHAVSGHGRDALHEMRRTDEARADRAPEPRLRLADLPVHPLRHRRKLPQGDVDRLKPHSAARSSTSAGCGSLLAGDLRRRFLEDPGARDLRCDQECRHDGRHADQPENLIHRKHCLCPPRQLPRNAPKAVSIRRLCDLLTGQHPIGIGRPTDCDQSQN